MKWMKKYKISISVTSYCVSSLTVYEKHIFRSQHDAVLNKVLDNDRLILSSTDGWEDRLHNLSQ